MGFKSIINEYYAKDISKKVRSSLRTIAEKGFFTGAHAPYGYLIDPDNKHHLIPDEATMPIVKEMFTLAAEGVSCRQIAIQFTERGIQTPREYLARTTGLFKKYLETLQEWATNSVANMLKSEVYIGSITSQKTTTKSFKNVQKVYKPKSEWVVVPNCHEPIVDKETFDLAQSLIRRRKRTPAEVNPNIFSGLVKCSSCGSGLSYSGACRNRSIAIFICNLYRSKSRKNLCTSHYISYNDLYKAVLSQVQKLTAFVEEHEGEFEAFYNQYLHDNANNNETTKQRELAKLQKRNVEVDTIIKGLFEQNFLGTLTSKRLAVLVADYETEQAKLQERIEEIEKSLSGERNALLDAGYFFKAISKYKDITELNPVLLHELIEKICVHHATGAGYGRKQRVDIYWKFIGLLDDKRH
ncbi:MAG: recombinase family protein [Oscillospiraceae bacterium]|nr:recombinase family protein [Oscillospiraceae bacterium]